MFVPQPISRTMSFSISPSYYHSLLGIGLGLWLYVLLVLLAPYDVAPLGFAWRAQLMLPYGVIFALSYQSAHAIEQRFLTAPASNWWMRQLYFVLILALLNFPFTYWYYQSPLVLGEFSFWEFTFQLYLPTLIIVIPMMLYGRRQLERLPTKINNQVILRGENKRDLLQLSIQEILYIETARNYVAVHYRHEEGGVRKRLLRTTLKKVIGNHPELIQVHRSYAVNPSQITRWQGTKSIIVNEQEIPVSDSFRKELTMYLQTRP